MNRDDRVRPVPGSIRPSRWRDSAVTRRAVDLRVAAALSRRPFGVRSSRTIAQLVGLGQPAVVRSLRRLRRAGVVTRRTDLVAADRAQEVAVWAIDWRSEAWHAIASEVGRVALPAPVAAQAGPALPRKLAHLFWQSEVEQLCPTRHGHLVASRILRSDDCQALGWLAVNLQPAHILAASEGRGLDRRRVALARVLAARAVDPSR